MLVSSSTLLANQTIVVLGDSLSASHGMSVQQGWVHLLQKKLGQNQSNYQVINESVSGETTAGGLARIRKVLTHYQPAVLILELGANDGLRGFSPQNIKNNLAEIILVAQEHKTKILLLSMHLPPNYGQKYTKMFADIYVYLAQKFQVSIMPFLFDEIVQNPKLIQKDGLHPNAKAQSLILNKIWQYLKVLL